MMVPAARVSALCDKMSRDPGSENAELNFPGRQARLNFDEIHETVRDNTYDFIWNVLETTSI